MRAAALLMITGSLIFGLGAGMGVPGVFMLTDTQARMDLLQKRMLYWRAAQPLYVIGPLISAAGVILLGAATDDDTAKVVWLLAGILMLAGVGAWSIDCFLRAKRPADFVFGRLPGWPFVVYVLTTILGFALIATGFVAAGDLGWLFWPIIVGDLGFLVFYLVSGDIPPFFFYTVMLAVGIVLINP